MTTTYHGAVDQCLYEFVSGAMAGCPRFAPRLAISPSGGSVVTCAHVRCSIAPSVPGGNTEGVFYARCLLRTGDFEAERSFVVPLD